MAVFQLELTLEEEAIASQIAASKQISRYSEQEKALFDKMEAAAKKFETIAILAVLLGELLGLKIDDYKVHLCNELLSYHVNDFEQTDFDKLSLFFEFLFGYKLTVSDTEGKLDFSPIDQLVKFSWYHCSCSSLLYLLFTLLLLLFIGSFNG